MRIISKYIYWELDVAIIELSFILELSYCIRLGDSPGSPTLREGEQHLRWSSKLSTREKKNYDWERKVQGQWIRTQFLISTNVLIQVTNKGLGKSHDR